MADKEKDKNRKTTIPVDRGPKIVNWLLENCTHDELSFMASLASKKNLALLASIVGRLTDANVYEMFYMNVRSSEELLVARAASRGEVSGMKAFIRACQLAKQKIEEKEERK